MISHPRNRILLTLLKVERFERWTIKLNKFFEDVMIYTRQDANLDTTTDCINGQSAATLIWTKSATSPNRHQVYDFPCIGLLMASPPCSVSFLLLNATFYAQSSCLNPPHSSFLVTTKSSVSLSPPPSTTIPITVYFTQQRALGDVLDVLVDWRMVTTR